MVREFITDLNDNEKEAKSIYKNTVSKLMNIELNSKWKEFWIPKIEGMFL